MLAEGLGLMVAGMGMVFSFLALLVLVMMVSAKFFNRFSAPVQVENSQVASEAAGPHRADGDLVEIAIAIAAAKARTRR